MLLNVARFEFRYLLRNPLLWIAAIAIMVMFFLGASVEGFDLGNEGGLLKNAAYATLRNYVIVSVFLMFVTTSFVANAVLRDDETGFGPIIRSTGITRFEYVMGRFAGAFAVAAACLLVVPLAGILGSLMPWAPAEQVGPIRLADYAYGYFVVGLPNLFIHAAVFFVLATITRSMMATYLGVVFFISSFFFSDGFPGNDVIAIAEPFAGRALKNVVRYWTVAERNVNLPELSGPFIYNRLLWVSVAIGCVIFASAVYRFADQGMTKREKKRLRLTQPLEDSERVVQAASLPSPEHGSRAIHALLLMRTRFEFRQVLLSPAIVVLMAWGLFTTFTVLTSRDIAGRPTFPTTLTLIPNIQEAFAQLLIVIAIYYAGELVWRERDRRVHEIVDATPLPNWAYVVPKTLAMALVLVGIVLVNLAAAVLFQLVSGYTDIELGKYLLWYVLPATWDALLIAALAIFVQALSPHKTVGWAIMIAFIVWQYINTYIDHNLLNYGASPGMPFSDMNGAGSFWKGAWAVRLYWGAFAALLLVVSHLLWRRGTETRLRPRLAAVPRRLTGGVGLVAGSALVVFAAAGAYAFYNINILSDYKSPLTQGQRQADLEKKYYWKYRNLPQPTVANMRLVIDLYPEELRAVTKGRYVLRNLTAVPIRDIHVRLLEDDFELTMSGISGARLVTDDRELNYQIYRLNSPMLPGEERELLFETLRWHRGFRNGPPNTRLVENGTYLSKDELTPVIGMTREGTIEDATARKFFGLPKRGMRAKVEDLSATMKPADHGGWVSADITLSTTADQTPIAPGRKVQDEVRDGRRIARFVSEAPIRENFSIQSARYTEKHRNHKGVDLAVYYHAPHSWNVDRMLDALAASLDYYQASFGPYQFSHVRILESPGYTNSAQAFAGTIPYSETYGFIADLRDPKTLDHVTGTTAHELSHQYWPEQAYPADMEGSLLLVEGLANYSAMMMLKRMRGEKELRGGLRYLRARYLGGRAGWGPAGEPPLIRVETQNWVTYNKTALAMFLLQERLGEDAINRALRNYLERYRFKGAPYARSLDLVAALRAEAKTEQDQNLITDLFERVILYDLRVTEPTAVQRPDGKWDVTVPIEAKKLAVDSSGAETETTLAEPVDVGLFTAHPGSDGFDAKNVSVLERRQIRSGSQVVKFVEDRKPTHAGVDPYNYYIDRNSVDNVLQLSDLK